MCFLQVSNFLFFDLNVFCLLPILIFVFSFLKKNYSEFWVFVFSFFLYLYIYIERFFFEKKKGFRSGRVGWLGG